jgi:hypothetical protein
MAIYFADGKRNGRTHRTLTGLNEFITTNAPKDTLYEEAKYWKKFMDLAGSYGMGPQKVAWAEDNLKPRLEEKKMNKNIATVYEKTADAVLVDKYLGHEISGSFTGLLILQANKEAYLAEAKARQEKADKNPYYSKTTACCDED